MNISNNDLISKEFIHVASMQPCDAFFGNPIDKSAIFERV